MSEPKEFYTLGDLKLVVSKSKKTDKRFVALVMDLGYTTKYLTFNYVDIAEIVGESTRTLAELPEGVYDITHEE